MRGGRIGCLGVSAQPPGTSHGLARAVAEAGFRTRRLSEADGADPPAPAREILRARPGGRCRARAVVTAEGRTIGEAIATVCAVVDPELVLLHGPVGSRPALLEPVREAVRALVPPPPPVEPGAPGAPPRCAELSP
ncbi:ROK family protein [Streptomyces sp. NPDC046197]|uniref:ROK family protein n=1 Tax=Streptomyces sp. NPDC046197 TaxID=3154337 RepID=UPI003407A087